MTRLFRTRCIPCSNKRRPFGRPRGPGHHAAGWLCQSAQQLSAILQSPGDRGSSRCPGPPLAIPARTPAHHQSLSAVIRVMERSGRPPRPRIFPIRSAGRTGPFSGTRVDFGFALQPSPLHTSVVPAAGIQTFGYRIGLPKVDRRWYPSDRTPTRQGEEHVSAEPHGPARSLLGCFVRLVYPPLSASPRTLLSPHYSSLRRSRPALSRPSPILNHLAVAFSSAELPRR